MEKNSTLINTMASDMNLSKYPNEDWEQYVGRVIYTAMVLWIKTSTLDTDFFNEMVRGRSKHYIFQKCSHVLMEILSVVPEAYSWFWSKYEQSPKNNNHPIRILRERMLQAGEIVEVGFKSDIAIPDKKMEILTSNVIRIIGMEPQRYHNLVPSGLTWLLKGDNPVNTNETTLPTEFLEWIVKSAKWETTPIMFEMEYFNPYKKSAPYKSWITNLTFNNEEEIILGRTDMYNDQKEYYLIKKTLTDIFWYKLNQFFVDQKAERRIILALRKQVNNPVTAQAVVQSNNCLLKLFSLLPMQEEIIIQTFCWPQNGIADKLNYVMPVEIWPYIRGVLDELEIEVRIIYG